MNEDARFSAAPVGNCVGVLDDVLLSIPDGLKDADKDKGKKDCLGTFHTFQHYMKLYDILKGAYSNYKVRF